MAPSKKRAYIIIASTTLVLLNTIPTTIAANDNENISSESSSLRRLQREGYNSNKRGINDIAADKTAVGNSHNRLLRQAQNIYEVQSIIPSNKKESSTQNDNVNNNHRQLNFQSWYQKFIGGGDEPTTSSPQTPSPSLTTFNDQTLPPDAPLPTNPPVVISTPAPSSSGSIDPLNDATSPPPTLQMVQNSAATLSPTSSNPTPIPSLTPSLPPSLPPTPSPTKTITTEPTPQIVAKTTTTTNNTPRPTRKIYSPGVRNRPTRDPTPLPTPVVSGTPPTTSSPVVMSDEPTKEIDPKSGGSETESPTVETSIPTYSPSLSPIKSDGTTTSSPQGQVVTTSSPTKDPNSRHYPKLNADGTTSCVEDADYPSFYGSNMLFNTHEACCLAYPDACPRYSHCASGTQGTDSYWYPHSNINDGSTYCASDNNYPTDYYTDMSLCMTFLFTSEEICCEKYPEACMEPNNDVGGLGPKWYPDLNNANYEGRLNCIYGSDYPWYMTTPDYMSTHLFYSEWECCNHMKEIGVVCGNELDSYWYPVAIIESGNVSCEFGKGYPLYMLEEGLSHLFLNEEECNNAWEVIRVADDDAGDGDSTGTVATTTATVVITPSPTDSPTMSMSPTASPTLPRYWWPDTTNPEINACVYSNTYLEYMMQFSEFFLYDDACSCCETHECFDMEGYDSVAGTLSECDMEGNFATMPTEPAQDDAGVVTTSTATTTTSTTTTANPTQPPSPPPTLAPTLPKGPNGKTIYAYPLVLDGIKLCVYDDSYPDWMVIDGNRDYFIYSSFQECCDAKGYPCTGQPTVSPSLEPTTSSPSDSPTTSMPTTAPPTKSPSQSPSKRPSLSPTKELVWFPDIHSENINACIIGTDEDYESWMANDKYGRDDISKSFLFSTYEKCCLAHACDDPAPISDADIPPLRDPPSDVVTYINENFEEGCPPEYEGVSSQDNYLKGDQVSVDGVVYECMHSPPSYNCAQTGSEPGTSGAGDLAWDKVGTCTGTATEALPWIFTGDRNWELTSLRSVSGSHSIRSGDLNGLADAESVLSIKIDSISGGYIKFSYFADLGTPFEWFDFEIDGQIKHRFAEVETEWLEYPEQGYDVSVGPGRHTITFKVVTSSDVPDFWKQRTSVVNGVSFADLFGRGFMYIDDLEFIPISR